MSHFVFLTHFHSFPLTICLSKNHEGVSVFCYYTFRSAPLIALYVVLDAPLSMLCDSPYYYEQEEECTDFITTVPTVWDETVILDGRMGEYILTARRKGTAWYIGGLSGWQGLQTTLDLSFLGEGSFLAELWQDGINADRFAADYKKTSQDVNRHTKLPLCLMPGGGFVARIIPQGGTKP